MYRHHGKGTYISDYGFDNSIFNFFSYGNQTGSSIRIYKTTPIRKKIAATSDTAFQLDINQGDEVIYLERRGYIDKKSPIIIEKSWWVGGFVEGYASNVVALPVSTSPFQVKRTAFSNKAFNITEINTDVKIVSLAKNSYGVFESASAATEEDFMPSLNDADFNVKIESVEKVLNRTVNH